MVGATNFPWSNALAASHKFWYINFLFTQFKVLSISLLISPLIHRLLKSVLVPNTWGYSKDIFVTYFWLKCIMVRENTFIIWILLNLLKFVFIAYLRLYRKMFHAHLKKDAYSAVGYSINTSGVKLVTSITRVFYIFLIFCLLVLKIIEKKVLKTSGYNCGFVYFSL